MSNTGKRRGGPKGIRLARQGRIKDVLALRQQGLKLAEIADRLGTTVNTVHRDLAVAQASGKKLPASLPRPGKWPLSKARTRELKSFTRFAIDVIEGRKSFEKKPSAPNSSFKQTLMNLDLALVKNPFNNNQNIATLLRVRPATVASRRKQLVGAARIPDVSVSERKAYAKRAGRKKPFLSKPVRNSALARLDSGIHSRTETLFQENSKIFDFLDLKPFKVKQSLKRIVESRLKSFDPAEMNGLEQTKLERFCKQAITQASNQIQREAQKSYKKLLRSPKPGLVNALTPLCNEYRLNVSERAVLFGLVAQLSMFEIGRRTALTREMIRQTKSDLRAFPSFEKRLWEIKKALGLEADPVKW